MILLSIFSQIGNTNSRISKNNACLPDRDQGSEAANPVMFYPKLLPHLPEHDQYT